MDTKWQGGCHEIVHRRVFFFVLRGSGESLAGVPFCFSFLTPNAHGLLHVRHTLVSFTTLI